MSQAGAAGLQVPVVDPEDNYPSTITGFGQGLFALTSLDQARVREVYDESHGQLP